MTITTLYNIIADCLINIINFKNLDSITLKDNNIELHFNDNKVFIITISEKK